VRPGRGAGIRRWAEETVPGPDGDRLVLPYADLDSFASWLVGYGADAIVLDPPALRDRVVARLQDVSAAHPVRGPAAPLPAERTEVFT
jgi:proteasome accessory factor B